MTPQLKGQVHAGVVEWNVVVLNQNEEEVAVYDILTLVKCKED